MTSAKWASRSSPAPSRQITPPISPSAIYPGLGRKWGMWALSCCSCTQPAVPQRASVRLTLQLRPCSRTVTACSCHTNCPRAWTASNIHQFKHILECYAESPQYQGFFQTAHYLAPHMLCALQEDISVSRKLLDKNGVTSEHWKGPVFKSLGIFLFSVSAISNNR